MGWLDWMRRHWDRVGLVVGVGLGLSDYGVFVLLGRPETQAPRPEVVALILAVVFGAMGFFVGRLGLARQRARRDAETIERQLEQLEEAQRTLVQQEKLAAVGRLAAGVAHEVRNPLGVIRASASMVQESFDSDSDPYRACEFICEESDRLNALINALLSFSRPTQPKRVPVSLEKVLDRALHLAGEELRKQEVVVDRQAASEPAELRADPDLLAQLLLDLLVNAAEAVGQGGRVAVRFGSGRKGVYIEVADDGPGVPEDKAAQIFEPFVTTKVRGTGLGLAMALRIAESHEGLLELAPGAGAGPGGAGACFRVELPHNGIGSTS